MDASRPVSSGNPPVISIGMPVYNGERFLREAVNSLRAQTFSDFEIIISDNGSRDRTSEICREFVQTDPRILYYRQAATLPARENFNFVLERAQGEFFMWAACDDLWEPRFAEVLLQLLRNDSQAVMAFCAFDSVDEGANTLDDFPRVFGVTGKNRALRLWRYLTQKERHGKANPIYGLMRRSVLLQAGGFKLWGKSEWGSDCLVVFRMLSFGEMALAKEKLFHKRQPRAGSLMNAPDDQLTLPQAVRQKMDYLSGYSSVLAMITNLTFPERLLLWTGLQQQRVYVYWREGMQRALNRVLKSRRSTMARDPDRHGRNDPARL